jgi:hypothetical protein
MSTERCTECGSETVIVGRLDNITMARCMFCGNIDEVKSGSDFVKRCKCGGTMVVNQKYLVCGLCGDHERIQDEHIPKGYSDSYIQIKTPPLKYASNTCNTCNGKEEISNGSGPNTEYMDCAVCNENVSHPSHYNKGDIECIDAIASAITNLEGEEAFYTGNVIKYMWRWKEKNGIEDLEKAKFYIDLLVDHLRK